MSKVGTLEARVDFLTLRIEQLHDRLIDRADALGNQVGLTGREAWVAVVLAEEFRQLAGVLE